MNLPNATGDAHAEWYVNKTIRYYGDTWRILATGTTKESGAVYCHLASTTRSHKQRNGSVPVQMEDYIPADILAHAE
jgi:hypothetical protein